MCKACTFVAPRGDTLRLARAEAPAGAGTKDDWQGLS